MAVVFPPETEYAKEMRRHNAYPSEFGPAGRPFVYHEFPKMLYKAARNAAGKIELAEHFKVNSELEERNMLSRGFHVGPDNAVAAIEREQQVHGELAAEREYAIRHGRHSEAAVREIRTAEAEHKGHMPVMPETPIKRRGRKPKVAHDVA